MKAFSPSSSTFLLLLVAIVVIMTMLPHTASSFMLVHPPKNGHSHPSSPQHHRASSARQQRRRTSMHLFDETTTTESWDDGVRLANVVVIQALESAREAQAEVKAWSEKIREDPSNDTFIRLQHKANERLKKTNERVKEANERLDKARAYHLKLIEMQNEPRRCQDATDVRRAAEWKEELDPVYSIEGDKMHFVNRDDATAQLQQIHRSKYNRAASFEGVDWIIPLADNVPGLGKSAFGKNYIRKCREKMKSGDGAENEFIRTLCACHTVHIVFTEGELVQKGVDAEAVLISRLCEQLQKLFTIPPVILSDPPTTADTLLKALTNEVGPLFVVLDEIGLAFKADDLNDMERRESLFKFCEKIVAKWFILEKVFFLLLGRASFSSYVGQRPTATDLMSSPYKFSRLSIPLLRPGPIKDIIENTYKRGSLIKVACDLDDTKCEAVAKHLFHSTCGHPRSLLQAFRACDSYKALMNYRTPVDLGDWAAFYNYVRNYKSVVLELLSAMDTKAPVDLTAKFADAGQKLTPYDIIASNCFIAWEGDMNNAVIYALPFVQQTLQQFVLPLRDYLTKLTGVEEVSVDYPTVFEWICLKRFQEMFGSKTKPSEVSPAFFDTKVFGQCANVVFPKDCRVLPKITTNTRNMEPLLDSPTADPSTWPRLLKLIDQIKDNGSVCLKPRPESSSSDVILMSKTAEGKDLTVGLAVKNLGGSEFSQPNVNRESAIFDRMFVNCENPEDRVNVLIVCATKYNKTLSRLFNGRCSATSSIQATCKNIDEIILLDLSTSTKRAQFFGLAQDPLASTLEDVIRNVEVEFEKSYD